ncbi:MAG: hypothetical protein KC501_23285 [Myxococcales bacterium]|nr:hypothetical protein [Myxococcales bacterium]
MPRLRWIAIPLVLALGLPPAGCGLFRRRSSNTTNVESSVQINQQGRDVATLERDQYEVIETSIGTNKSNSVFVLTIPVGSHTTHDEQVDSAYYMAVDRIPECDALLMPRVDTRRTLVPLLLVNIVIKKTTVKGRCIHVKDDATLAGHEPEAGSDTGGGEAEEPGEPEPAEAGGSES